MMKRALIIKEPSTKIAVKSSHVETVSLYETQYIGLNQLYGVYIAQEVTVNVKALVALAKVLPVYFTTAEGKLLSKVSLQV